MIHGDSTHQSNISAFKKRHDLSERESDLTLAESLKLVWRGSADQYLAPLADQLVALDPSARAIRRARVNKIANASFQVGDLMSYEPQFQQLFDLVTACEVLYI